MEIWKLDMQVFYVAEVVCVCSFFEGLKLNKILVGELLKWLRCQLYNFNFKY